MRFEDRVCLVTGGGSGIGRAAWLQFGREGAKVAVADVSDPHGAETAHSIEAAGGEAIFNCVRGALSLGALLHAGE